jgi:FdhE protein
MKAAQTGGPDYNARTRRAQHLASVHPFAAEVLHFYEHVANFQKILYGRILQRPNELAGPIDQAKVGALLPHFPEILEMVERFGPSSTAQAAHELAAQGREKWWSLLTEFWVHGRSATVLDGEVAPVEPLTEFILRAFLQPYAEFLAAGLADPPAATTYRECPRCTSAPLLGVLRPEGDGGKRRLLCSFCLQEWDFRRIFCPACGEAEEQKLPVYVAEKFAHVRVESCETCKFYVRTIDLTKDGHAVPIVDDLAAIPLSLWAEEHGYRRLQGNLLGT